MQRHPFSRNWRFQKDDERDGPRWKTTDDSTWRHVDLPHDWSIEGERALENPSEASNGFFPTGRGWYQKRFSAPAAWRGKKVLVEFEGVYMNAEVWLNDNFLGRHPYGYTSFHLDLTPNLRWDEPNVLRVFVDNSHQLNSRWYSGSGIYRPVWLLIGDLLHIAPWGLYVTTPTVSSEAATVQVETRVVNETGQDQALTVAALVRGTDGSDAGRSATDVIIPGGGEETVIQTVEVSEPALWSPEGPALYQLEAELLVEGQVTDSASTPFGIRTLQFSAEEGFMLNGKSLLLKGGCVHHDNGILGAASYPQAEERKVALHKANGYNAIRCAHNPPAPAFLDACDRLGMLVIDEAFDCWREGKNAGDYHVAFDDWWQRDLDSMLYRDRNHPSIIMWSIGNEVLERDGRGDGVAIARALVAHVHDVDPTRPVTAGINGSWTGGDWEEMDAVFATLDIGGYNYQRDQYRPDHEHHPQRIMMGTESFPLQAWENWQDVRELPYVIGDFVWTSLDYLGEAGIGRVHFDGEPAPHLADYPWHQANCGDLDLCGSKRPQSYYRDLLWHEEPRVYIAVHTPLPDDQEPTISRWGWPDVWHSWNWAGHEGELLQVDVYSSCDAVELLLNGNLVDKQSVGRNEPHIASFMVPYEPGELLAIGYVDGERVAEYRLGTAGAPFALRLTADRMTLSANSQDLSYITVEVLDEAGMGHPTASNNIHFSVSGPGEIIAVGNSDPQSEEPYVGDRRSVHHGRALVVVKASGEAGTIHLRAEAQDLQAASIAIQAYKESKLLPR